MSILKDLVNLNLSGTTVKVIAEYIWIGQSGLPLSSKSRTLSGPISDPQKLPKWSSGGCSSADQAPGVVLSPQAVFKDPFRRGNNILVMCDAYTPAGAPVARNDLDIFLMEPLDDLRYGIEQEYSLLRKDVQWPIGWPGGFPGPQGPSYCSVGADTKFGRDILDSFYKSSLYAGINIGEIKEGGDASSGKWKFQVGPDSGISAANELWVARYILERIAKIDGAVVTFNPNLIQVDWCGAGTLTNHSTRSRRSDCGLDLIKKGVEMIGNAFSMGAANGGAANGGAANRGAAHWGAANRGAANGGAANRGAANGGVGNRSASICVGYNAGKAGKVKLE